MSRGGRSDIREVAPVARSVGDDVRQPTGTRGPQVPMDRVALPRGDQRQPIALRDRTYRLRGSEARILATVGTFRVVRADDLQAMRTSRDAWTGDLRSLLDQGLVETRTVDINHHATAVVVLTSDGVSLLEAHRDHADDGRRSQQFHAGLVKPREVAHDAQLYRLYQAEAARIHDEGGRVVRVVLDYELKHDYQTFLNRADRPDDATTDDDRRAFAASRGLPIVDGHLALPDLRVEYETEDGRLAYRDLELVTEHYSRGQLASKAQAGFTCYRAAGAGRGRGGSSKTGGTPFDPHHLERL